jgi:DNA transformation protein and related proteins
MAISSEEKEFAAYVVDLMQSIGPVESKRMFGGFGVFLDGLMFGLITGNVLYIKADEDSKKDFLQLGLLPFSYSKKDKTMSLSYYQAPEEAMENVEIMSGWANKGFAAALRAAAKKRPSSGNRKKK